MLTTGSALQLSLPRGAQHEHLQLPPLQPFQKRLYYSSDTTGVPPTNGSGSHCSDVVPINLSGIDPVSYEQIRYSF